LNGAKRKKAMRKKERRHNAIIARAQERKRIFHKWLFDHQIGGW
jgi:hypothetical protein